MLFMNLSEGSEVVTVNSFNTLDVMKCLKNIFIILKNTKGISRYVSVPYKYKVMFQNVIDMALMCL